MPLLREAIAHCESVRDFVSRELFEAILDGEEEHVDFLETQLGLIDQDRDRELHPAAVRLAPIRRRSGHRVEFARRCAAARRGPAGSASTNIAPPPGASATDTVAPCISAMRATIDRPSPALPGRRRSRRQNRRKICSRSAAGTPGPRSLTRNAAGGVDIDLDRGAGRGMGQRVLDQVADRAADRVGIAAHQHRPARAGHRHRLVAATARAGRGTRRSRPRRRPGRRFRRRRSSKVSSSAISSSWLTSRLMFSTSCAQRLRQFAVGDHVDLGAQDGQRRAQFVRGIGGEFALAAEPFLEPVERLIDRMHQRQDLLRHSGFGQAQIGAASGRSARPGPTRRRSASSARRKIATSMTSSSSRIGAVTQPTRVKEIGDDVVDQHVAMRQILRYLDPQVLARGDRPAG